MSCVQKYPFASVRWINKKNPLKKSSSEEISVKKQYQELNVKNQCKAELHLKCEDFLLNIC